MSGKWLNRLSAVSKERDVNRKKAIRRKYEFDIQKFKTAEQRATKYMQKTDAIRSECINNLHMGKFTHDRI